MTKKVDLMPMLDEYEAKPTPVKMRRILRTLHASWRSYPKPYLNKVTARLKKLTGWVVDFQTGGAS